MIYPSHLEEKIGFDKIRQMLRRECLTELGAMRVEEMSWMNHFEKINEAQALAAEFVHIRRDEESFTIGSFYDLRTVLNAVKPIGTWLNEDYIHQLKLSLETLSTLASFFSGERKITYPFLSHEAEDVLLYPEILKEIKVVFDDEGRMKDNASPELLQIRHSLRREHQTLSRRIQSVLTKAKSNGLIEGDVSPSIRDGRLVIPIEARNKRKINGIIHDESATGKTAYIEPAEVVEANNRIRELENEEKREIVKILVALTALVRPMIPDILTSFGFLGLIDFLRSKAILSGALQAIKPNIKPEPKLHWEEAKHPLLFLSFKKEEKQVVPLSVQLNKDDRLLLISGPNAGGKSVCLKTVGLIQYMAQCGLAVPLHEKSEIGIFDHIFIDIGDEQSLENDLSTYSSHLLNMKHFLKFSGKKTLLLVDEFGTGTEPQIGGAIAEAILEHLNQTGAFGVITTHYSNLKHFASQTNGILNGAMLFDQQNMRPLFQLKVGNPGSSYAIEMARKIGIPESVISLASDKIGQDALDFDKHLREILRDKSYWERKREDIRKRNKQIANLENTYKEHLQKVKAERSAIIEEARAEAAKIMQGANASIENTIRTIKESNADKAKTKDARKALETTKTELLKSEKDDAVLRQMEKLLRRQQRKGERKPKVEPQVKPKASGSEVLKKGDTVKIIARNTFAEILAIKGNDLELALGQLRITLKKKDVVKVSNKEMKRTQQKTYASSPAYNPEIQKRKLNFKQDLDIRGMRGEEAVSAVMSYVDDAIMMGATRLRILHGTGTGVLRQMVREYLATVDFVESTKDEHVQMGGAGITVVDLSYS